MTTKPKRITTKIKSDKFELPKAQLDLEFFLKRDDQKYTADQVIQEVFGDIGFKLTEQEKVYCLLDAMESLEITMPFEFECQHCHTNNPIAIEVFQVIHTEGEPLLSFRIEIDEYIFEFERPEHIEDTQHIGGIAGVGMYMMQWLVGHNQGLNFEFINLPIKIILNLAKEFAEKMFKVTFKVDSHCANCKEPIKEDFFISMDDLAATINEL